MSVNEVDKVPEVLEKKEIGGDVTEKLFANLVQCI